MDDDAHHQLEDVSIDSSIPTDISISEISDMKLDQIQVGKKASLRSKRQQQKERDRIARQLLEKKQLEHDLQLVKIELNQKEYLLENVRTEYKVKLEELEEKLQQCKHQNQILIAKSESQLTLQQDEARRKQERLKADLSVIKVRLREVETANENLTRKTVEIKQQLREHVDINEDKYYELRGTADELISMKDLIAMKMFETLRPYKVELDELKSRCERLHGNLKESEERANSYKQELDSERQLHAAAQVKLTHLTTSTQELEAKATNKDYRINNYDRINQERDDLERQVKELRERNTVLERDYSSADHDRKHFEQEHASAKSSLSLLTQDKDYLSRQVCDLTNKLAYSEERLQRQTAELDEVKHAREELFEKYVSSRDQYKSQYEQQLQAELKHMSASTQDEVEKLRATTRAMYEMESRTLREGRDIALSERDKAINQEAETQAKYQQLNEQYRQEKANLEAKVSDLSSSMKLAEYEKSRSQLLQEETTKTLRDSQTENEKLIKKLELANKEYFNLEMQFTKRTTEMEAKIKEYQTRIQAYENIEKELDEVIMQAAEVDTDEGAEKVMLSYGYGASIPASSQRRMKQSVHLARRCLALERQMVSDKRHIKELEEAIEELKQQLSEAKSKLDIADQPYSYILSKTQELEGQVRELKKAKQSLEMELKTMSRKYHNAAGDVKRLTQDLETSSRHGEEIGHMKEQLSQFLSKSVKMTKAKLMGEMTERERLLRAKRLIEQGTASGLHEAERFLKAVSLELNPATQVINREMSAFEAVMYLDTLLQNLESPTRGTQPRYHPVYKTHSQPIRSSTGKTEPEEPYNTTTQPQPFSLKRRTNRKPNKMTTQKR